MNKFDDVYHEILDDIKELPCEFGINEINELIKPKYKWFGIIEIVNEYFEEKTLKRSIEVPGNGFGLYLKHKDFFDKLFNLQDDEKPNNNVLEFIKYVIKPVEQDILFKHICMQFQGEYERNNKEISSYKDDERLNKNFEQRENWLNIFLNKISNNEYFNSNEWKNNLKLIKNNYEELSLDEKIKYDLIHAIIGFLIYENILPEKLMKEKLIHHFKTFKYMSN